MIEVGVWEWAFVRVFEAEILQKLLAHHHRKFVSLFLNRKMVNYHLRKSQALFH
jgi:hypothetical protein